MPIDVHTGEQQIFINWFYRLFIFLMIGLISGYGFHKIKESRHRIKLLYSHNPETNIPNTNYLSMNAQPMDQKPYLISSILINNHHNIMDILGTDV